MARGALLLILPTLLLWLAPDARAEERDRSRGQRLYVPVYSEVPFGAGKHTLGLGVTLSIRNVDEKATMTVTRIDYYDDRGKLVHRYIDEPQSVGPLASMKVVVAQGDRKGGVGASFLVEWRADAKIVAPVARCIMISTASAQGISFVTDGLVVEELDDQP